MAPVKQAYRYRRMVSVCLTVALLGVTSCATRPSVDATDARVEALIDQLTSKRTQADALRQLEAGGVPWVPYMVRHLDDDRRLGEPQVSFQNHAVDAFEGYRMYGPKVVSEALTGLLNQIVGRSFELIYNGGTSDQRAKNQKEWAAWCVATYPHQATVCDPEHK